MDQLKELSKQLGGKIRTQNLSNWNLDATSLRVIIIKEHKGCKIEINEFGSIFQICIKIESDFAFSINKPDKLFGFTIPITLTSFPYKLYPSNYNDPNLFQKKEFLGFWNPFSSYIKGLHLTENESIYFYFNKINFALNSDRDIVSIINDIIDLIKSNTSAFQNPNGINIYKKNIPEKLRTLFPLLKKWGISDDTEREQLLEETSENQKKKLFSTVSPLMKDINEFLDSFKDKPLSDEAILLGNIAELISELQADSK